MKESDHRQNSVMDAGDRMLDSSPRVCHRPLQRSHRRQRVQLRPCSRKSEIGVVSGYQMHRSTIDIFTCSPCFICPAHRVMWVLEAGLGHASGHRSPLSPLATTQEKWRGDSLDKPLIVKRKDPARVTSVSVTPLCPPVRSALAAVHEPSFRAPVPPEERTRARSTAGGPLPG